VNKKIILLTGYDNFFGQTRKPWVSINTQLLIQSIKDNGIEVEEYSFHQVLNKDLDIRDSIIFYTFSQRAYLRKYIKDVVFYLQQKGNIVIPDYVLLLCHENKGFQELKKKALHIDNLPAFYMSSKRELSDYNIEYPIVLKTLDGSNGKGVFLVQSQEQLLQTIKRIEPKLSFFTKLDLLRRRYLRLPKKFKGYEHFDSKKDLEQYKDYITQETGFVLQKFIPGLECDYRVTILGEHFFITKRQTRKGDFRASGAKRFIFDMDTPEALLDYAHGIFEMFDSPSLSLDIGIKDNEFFLFEFQALHFGINVIIRGKGFYQNTVSGWEFISQKPVFEQELSHAFITYLNKKNLF